MFKEAGIAVGLAVLLSACGTVPTRVALDPATSARLTQVHVYDVVPQDEVIVRAAANGASAALGGGLIGALIDSKVNESRQNTIQSTLNPFYAAVDDFDFRSRFAKALDGALRADTPLKFGPIEHSSLLAFPAQITTRTNATGAGKGLLYLTSFYTFSPDYKQLLVTTSVRMAQSGDEKVLFMNAYNYFSAPVGAGNAESLSAWGDQQGLAYRKAADDAIDQIMKMIKFDLLASATDPANLPTAVLPLPSGTPGKTATVPVVLAEKGRVIVRSANGYLHSIPQ